MFSDLHVPLEFAHVGLRVEATFAGSTLRNPQWEHEVTASA